MDARETAEMVARSSYGRLVAYLAARSRDVAGAEDALGDAFAAALRTWPAEGVPDRPEAWLLAVARRRQVDAVRRARREEATRATLGLALEAASQRAEGPGAFPDERLAMLFVCAHPAIDAGVRTPLMLQTVLGLEAGAIASAFLVAPATMSQRLVRAKAKMRDAGMRFEPPDPADWPARLGSVLEALYTAYGSRWEIGDGADDRQRGLADETVRLARLITELLPDEPEAGGLLALMLHCEARRDARRDAAGRYVPLGEQDVTRWSLECLAEAEAVLARAARAGAVGRYQLEAAIQSAHARRVRGRPADWEAIALLYEGLIRLSPTVGALLGRAAALGHARGPAAGLEALELLEARAVVDHQPYWAVRAHLLRALGRADEAAAAYARAVGLCEDPATREFLQRQAALTPPARPPA